jgi:hypothetical protein
MAGDTRLYVMRGPSGRTAFAVATPTGPRLVSLSGKTTDEIESDPEFGFYEEQALLWLEHARRRIVAKRELPGLLKRLV